MKYLINYADLGFKEAQKINSTSGIVCGFDSVIQYSKPNIDKKFLEENFKILDQKRGAGYWLWKPYFILKTLRNTNEGDIIFYSDSGAQFIKHMNPIFEKIEKSDRGVLIFRLPGHHKENEYCRKQVAEEVVNCDKEIMESDQHMASFVGLRNCVDSIAIICKWLNLCTKEHLITDMPPQEDEFPMFKDHRHDQSLLSLLSKKLNLETAPDPSQWGLVHKQTTEEDHFIYHHRNRQ
tara:strand:- start:6 stop:713 length:708 start_codon:yes stop_codon:yes gene_type:complete